MKTSMPGRALLLTIVASLGVAGCTTNPYTGERQPSKAAVGAGAGAAAGAIAGAISGDDSREERKRALIGAGIGALAGAAVGGYMDAQERKLREQLQGTGVSVTRQGDRLILNMPSNVTFATDSARIDSQFYPVLNSVSAVLEEYPKTVIEITGHTDSTGPYQYNMDLSRRRASSVSDYLVAQGIENYRTITRGVGPDQPVATNETAAGRQQNRRVELVLEPLARS